jgi:hypothetical protein
MMDFIVMFAFWSSARTRRPLWLTALTAAADPNRARSRTLNHQTTGRLLLDDKILEVNTKWAMSTK